MAWVAALMVVLTSCHGWWSSCARWRRSARRISRNGLTSSWPAWVRTAGPVQSRWRRQTEPVPDQDVIIWLNSLAGTYAWLRMMASDLYQLANDNGFRTTATRARRDKVTLHNVHYRRLRRGYLCEQRAVFVPSHGSWRISLILANDLAERCLVAMILRRAVEPVHPRTHHAQQIPSAKTG
jgi:hypothetical protein